MFRETGAVEQWGSGVQRMFRRAAELGLGEPSYVELPGRLRFIVPTRHAEIMMGGLRSSQLPDSSVLSDFSGPQVRPQVRPQVGLRAAEVLRTAAKAPVARTEIMAALGVFNDSKNAKRHIEPLLAAGLLALTEPDSPRSPTQRYWTTDAGLAWLASHGD